MFTYLFPDADCDALRKVRRGVRLMLKWLRRDITYKADCVLTVNYYLTPTYLRPRVQIRSHPEIASIVMILILIS